MAKGRTVNKFTRVYVDGYDLSGYARSIGPLDVSYETGKDDPLNAAVIGNWLGQASISPGTLNGIFDNTSDSGIHAIMNGAGVERKVMIPIGIQAAPAAGDDVFAGVFRQNDYKAGIQTPVIADISFGQVGNIATSDGYLNYSNPWGILVHAHGAETGANSSDGLDLGAVATTDSTTDGGWMMYQIFTAAGTGDMDATLAVQHATANSSSDFVDLLTTGALNLGAGGAFTGPYKGVVALAKNATVNRYVRWQLTLGAATSVTFALSFHRNYIP